MTVKDLKAILNKCDENMEVVVNDSEWGEEPPIIEILNFGKETDRVIISC